MALAAWSMSNNQSSYRSVLVFTPEGNIWLFSRYILHYVHQVCAFLSELEIRLICWPKILLLIYRNVGNAALNLQFEHKRTLLTLAPLTGTIKKRCNLTKKHQDQSTAILIRICVSVCWLDIHIINSIYHVVLFLFGNPLTSVVFLILSLVLYLICIYWLKSWSVISFSFSFVGISQEHLRSISILKQVR